MIPSIAKARYAEQESKSVGCMLFGTVFAFVNMKEIIIPGVNPNRTREFIAILNRVRIGKLPDNELSWAKKMRFGPTNKVHNDWN